MQNTTQERRYLYGPFSQGNRWIHQSRFYSTDQNYSDSEVNIQKDGTSMWRRNRRQIVRQCISLSEEANSLVQ
jgi:hypothetical protein